MKYTRLGYGLLGLVLMASTAFALDKISERPTATSPTDGTEVIGVIHAGVDQQIAWSNLLKINGGVPAGGNCPSASASATGQIQIAGGNAGNASAKTQCGNVVISYDANNTLHSCVFCVFDTRNQQIAMGLTGDDKLFRVNGIINIGPSFDGGAPNYQYLGVTVPSAVQAMYLASPDIGTRATTLSSTVMLLGCGTNSFGAVCGTAVNRPDHILAFAGATNANIATTPVFRVSDVGIVAHGGSTVVTTQFDKTSATLADVTGLSVTVNTPTSVVAGKGKYKFTAKLHVNAAAAGGEKFAIAGTATATNIIYQVRCANASTNAIVALTSARQTSLAGAVGENASSVTTLFCEIEGFITVNATGTLTVQFAQNSASGTSSVLVGSTFTVEEIF